MPSIYICKHHTYYGYQENENADVALVTSDIAHAQAWCDAFTPVIKNTDMVEWRSFTKMELDKDYCVSAKELHGSVFDIDVPITYTQDN